MNLTSDLPYWLLRNGLLVDFPRLDQDLTCECVIVGAGITGAILGDHLTRLGRQVVIVDGRDICTGSTSASTALLQYEIDVPLLELRELIGIENANRAYRLSHDSIDQLETLARSLDVDVGFARKTSIYLADNRKMARQLALETRARRELGLDAVYCNQAELNSEFGLPGTAAIANGQAAACDPYRFASALLQRISRSGGQVYDRTRITKFQCDENQVRLITEKGPILTANHVIIANGYESQTMLKENIVDLVNTYALVSEPLNSLTSWNQDWMLWECKEPYLYLRITADQRLLVGGEDDRFHSPARRDAAITQKADKISGKVRQLMPELEWETAFTWGGTFGKTRDGLAYIGQSPEYPGCYFALGFGGNGITFSAIAAQLIPAMLEGKTPPLAELFRFGR